MPFRIGLSGLNAAQAELKITGNNIANVGTVGFKESRAEFADVYATSKFGSVSTAIGTGVRLAAAAQQFTQGNVLFTENNLDLGISGEGFFSMSDISGNQVYTRNGQFKTDKEGYIVDNSGSNLRGYGVDAITNNINTGSIVDLRIVSTNIAPNATSESSLVANIDSGGSAPAFNFSMNGQGTVDPTSYNHTTSFTSYDSLGNPMLTSLYFRKTDTNDWDIGVKQVDINGNIFQNMDKVAAGAFSGADIVEDAALAVAGTTVATADSIHAAYLDAYKASTGATPADRNIDAINAAVTVVPGGPADPVAVAVLASLATAETTATASENNVINNPAESVTFLNNGKLDPATVGTGNGVMNYTFDLSSKVNPVMSATGGPITIQTIGVNLSGLTQYGANFGVTNLTQNGYTTGQLSGIDVDQSGAISARFTNGQSNNMGQVFLTNFTNTQGLGQLGDNYWAESFASGQGIVNAPGEGNAGLINSGALEDSNVDLTQQLINLITAQRNFQANAKTITTVDKMTQTVIQL